MTIPYSPSTNAFYNPAWQTEYEQAGTWPNDLVEVSDSVFEEFSGAPPEGKQRVAGTDGMPIWGEIPPMSLEDQITAALQTKNTLLRQASDMIAPLQDAVDLEMATDEEKALLVKWKQYRVALNRVDTSNPETIEWPQQPG